MPPTVRRATLRDLDRRVPLFDAYRQFYSQKSDLVIARKFLVDRLSWNESIVLIAEDRDGAVIGFTQLFPTFSSILSRVDVFVSDLFVASPARRRGVGVLLMKAATGTARAAGAVRLELATAVTSAPAQMLYEGLGWKRDDKFYVYGLPLSGEEGRGGHG